SATPSAAATSSPSSTDPPRSHGTRTCGADRRNEVARPARTLDHLPPPQTHAPCGARRRIPAANPASWVHLRQGEVMHYEHANQTIAAIGAVHHGVITEARAAEHGISPAVLRRRAAAGLLTKVDRATFLIAGTPATWA